MSKVASVSVTEEFRPYFDQAKLLAAHDGVTMSAFVCKCVMYGVVARMEDLEKEASTEEPDVQ